MEVCFLAWAERVAWVTCHPGTIAASQSSALQTKPFFTTFSPGRDRARPSIRFAMHSAVKHGSGGATSVLPGECIEKVWRQVSDVYAQAREVEVLAGGFPVQRVLLSPRLFIALRMRMMWEVQRRSDSSRWMPRYPVPCECRFEYVARSLRMTLGTRAGIR